MKIEYCLLVGGDCRSIMLGNVPHNDNRLKRFSKDDEKNRHVENFSHKVDKTLSKDCADSWALLMAEAIDETDNAHRLNI